MFGHNLNDKQKRNKKQKGNQNLITSFIHSLVKYLVFAVGKINSDYKTNKKNSSESPLTSCEHLFQIFNKFTQM